MKCIICRNIYGKHRTHCPNCGAYQDRLRAYTVKSTGVLQFVRAYGAKSTEVSIGRSRASFRLCDPDQ